MNAATITELAISVITLVSAWFIGNKSVWGQRLSLIANLSWWFYVIAFGRWGLAPMQAFFLVITIRNLIKWEKERRSP
jgi:hypothetical protein